MKILCHILMDNSLNWIVDSQAGDNNTIIIQINSEDYSDSNIGAFYEILKSNSAADWFLRAIHTGMVIDAEKLANMFRGDVESADIPRKGLFSLYPLFHKVNATDGGRKIDYIEYSFNNESTEVYFI